MEGFWWWNLLFLLFYFVHLVQECKNIDQAAPLKFHLFCKKKLSLDFSLHGHFLSGVTWFEFSKNTICLEWFILWLSSILLCKCTSVTFNWTMMSFFTSLSLTVYRYLLPNLMMGNFLISYSICKECGKLVTTGNQKFWLATNFSLYGF